MLYMWGCRLPDLVMPGAGDRAMQQKRADRSARRAERARKLSATAVGRLQ